MRWLVIVTLLLGAHFALTAIAPGEKALFYWPFAKDSKPTLDLLGSATKPVTQLLSVVAGLCFLASVGAILGWLVPLFAHHSKHQSRWPDDLQQRQVG
jgi:hypothetical protein